MDSLSQLVLGSAVGVAVMGRRTAVWKAAAWGAVCGTLPDLDALIDFGDPVRNMTMHRGDSHALFYLTLAAPLVGPLIAWASREASAWRRWTRAVWAILITHVLLDLMTVYGTQLARPFSDHPYGVGSLFIIDPLYTLPLIVGLVGALMAARGSARAPGASASPGPWRWNAFGLAASTLYVAWSVLAQQHVTTIARASLQAQGVSVERLLVTPAPLNTVLWRIVVVTRDDRYLEGFYSLFDEQPHVRFEAHERGTALYEASRGIWAVERIAWFSHGFFRMREQDGAVYITDLRMGQEPAYVFRFLVARRASAPVEVTPVQEGFRPDLRTGLPWLWRRMWGDARPLPG